MRSRLQRAKGFVLAVLLLTAMTAPQIVVPEGARSLHAADDSEYYELMKLFVDTFEEIDRNYVKPVDRKELVESALQGMLSKLDPYSSYLNDEDKSRFDQEVDQEFGGIGIQVNVDPRTRYLMVMTPLPGTPAYKAGILAGDRIIQINGKNVAEFPEGQEMDTAVRLMRGKPGETVQLQVLHEGSETPTDITVERAIIKTLTVLGDHYNDDGTWSYFVQDNPKIAYLRLTHFSKFSVEEMQEALEAVTRDGMQGLILDLRFNPGGLLTAATAIADQFVESGVIVSTIGRNTEPQVVQAKKAGTFSGFPMVVLINRYSASASEIVSACLQDHHRAVVIGERSWGKGSVQNLIPFGSDRGALKLTTASYHRPSGKNIHRFPDSKPTDEWGVSPDAGYLLDMTVEQMRDYLEDRQKLDILRSGASRAERTDVDPQLAKAVEYLVGQVTGKSAGESDKAPADATKPTQPDAPKDAAKDPEAATEEKPKEETKSEGEEPKQDSDSLHSSARRESEQLLAPAGTPRELQFARLRDRLRQRLEMFRAMVLSARVG